MLNVYVDLLLIVSSILFDLTLWEVCFSFSLFKYLGHVLVFIDLYVIFSKLDSIISETGNQAKSCNIVSHRVFL